MDKKRDTFLAYAFLTPFLLIYLFFLAYPFFYSFYLSLHRTTLYTDWYAPFSDMTFVGFSNYFEFLTSLTFWYSLFLTLLYALFTIPTGIFLSLLLAIALKKRLPLFGVYRTVYFLPHVLDIFAFATVWVFLFSPHYGLFDQILSGLTSQGLLANPWTCLPTIALVMVLKNVGFGMVFFLAALDSIPPSLYEAAALDGASPWQTFWHITCPLVRPTARFLALLGLVSSLTAFTEVYAMTSNTGGPATEVFGHTVRSANLVGYYLYQNFAQGYYGRAAALSFLLLFVALVLSLWEWKKSQREVS